VSSDSNIDTGQKAVDSNDVEEQYAAAFNQETDPLGQYSQTLQQLPDPFEFFITNVLHNRDTINDDDTFLHYRRTYNQWREHIAAITPDRHPACPTPKHVQRFIEWRRDVHGNSRRTIKGKLSRLNQAYEYWQKKSMFPHPADWNPFIIGKEETTLGENSDKDYHDLSVSDLQSQFSQIRNIRRRAIIGTQLKEGLRAGEECNLQIPEIHISSQELQQRYPGLGTHPAIGDKSDVLYVPHDRDGNKSSNTRLLPIDEELRWLLLRHLLTRPQVDEPWVFLSKRTFTQMTPQGVNKEWKEAFHPEYAETDDCAPVTSHYGRHHFSSYWRLVEGLEREHVQYMRGDRVQPLDDFPYSIDDYLHPNYDLIESAYRQNIFKLNISLEHSQLD
jgi:integrase/recombinase XerD